MEWPLMLWVSVLRKPTALEIILTLLLLLPFLSSLLYRLYAKIKRRDGRSVGLQILSNTSNDDQVKYEIVAVHGLGANPEHTWTCKSNSKSKAGDTQPPVHLLKDLLMKDERFSDARILHFAYNSDWLVDACFESARDIGRRLIECLAEHRKNHARLPMIFVGHSFGGIVIKEALSSDPEDSQKILEDTCGIIFLGTPHLGSPVAGFGATVAYLTGFLGSNTGLLLLLRSNGELLVNLSIAFQECLERKYQDLDKKTKIISICEQKPTYLLNWLYAGMIVPLHSATFGTNFMDVFKVNKDHSGLNKCRSADDPLYIKLTEQLNRIRPNAPSKINTLQQAVIDRLMPPITVPDAEFHPGLDEYGIGSLECLPQTREEILKDICDWLDDSFTSQKHLYWLQGKAGTGKTTIARTVVSRMAEKNRTIANFFFKRGEGDRARLKRFFTTLAAQLVRKSPSFAKAVQDALESDPSLPEQDPKVQFKKLIQEPMTKQKFDKSKPIIVIIDALDECDSNEDLATLVHLINQPMVPDDFSARLPIKYFLTSRLDHHTQPISNKTPRQKCEKKELENTTSETIKRDIELYLRFHLEKIENLLDPTPTGDPWAKSSNLKVLKELTERAYPLFEFAAAACRFIAQREIGDPRELLNDIMKYQTSGDLDMVYESIVKRRFGNLKGRYREKAKAQFQEVIGSVICLADSVDVRCLAQLTNLPAQAIRQELHLFQSVLVVPTEQDNQSSVRLFHESFRDFLMGPDTNEEFKVDSISAHKLLASRCRQILCKSLQENICKLESPGTHRSEVTDETIKEFIPQQIQYACRFWVYHIKRSKSNIQDGDEWHSFLLYYFLNWLEALSLLGRISESVSIIKDLKTSIHPSEGVKIKALLEDAERFILSFRHVIDTAPLQLYSSVLTFAPAKSLIRQLFEHCRSKWISHTPNTDSQWSPCLQTLEGQTYGVPHVVFSPDNTLVSGDFDGTIRIWDPTSGICLQTLSPGGTLGDHVSSLVFSKGGKLACRTRDSLTVWDIHQHTCLQKTSVEEHVCIGREYAIGSVVFTDEHTLMFAGHKLVGAFTLDLKTGHMEQVKHSFDNTRMILSSDGQLAACMIGQEIRVFNMNSEHVYSPKVLKTDHEPQNMQWKKPQAVQGVQALQWRACFSLDNQYFVSLQDSLQDYEIVKVWEVSSTTCLQVFRESWRICALAFSPDSRLLGMGFGTGEITIWDWRNHTRLKTFTGHGAAVLSLAFSPNGEWLASGSTDRTIKIWDNLTYNCIEKNIANLDTKKIAISMGSQRLATVSRYLGNIQMLDSFGKEYIVHPFQRKYCEVAVSANGSIIAAILWRDELGDENGVEIWDVVLGDHSTVRTRHRPYHPHSCSIALSSNGERFIISFNDRIVEVWESLTGRLLKEQEYGSQSSTRTAISPDGEQIAWTSGPYWKTGIHIENLCGGIIQDIRFDEKAIRSLGFSQDRKRLAAVGQRWKGAIWDVETGVCLRRFSCEDKRPPTWQLNPSFINFDSTKAVGLPVLEKWEECLAKYGISPDGAWVMRYGEKLLWIPPEYRPRDAVASGSNIAIGRASGLPFVVGFSDYGL